MKIKKVWPHLLGSAVVVMLTQCSPMSDESSPKHPYKQSSFSLVDSEDGIDVNYTLQDFKLTTKKKGLALFTEVKFPGTPRLTTKGYAELPYVSLTLQIPADQQVKAQIIASDEYDEFQLEAPLVPARGIIYRNQNPELIPYEIDKNSVTDSWYPQHLLQQDQPFIFRETRGITVRIYPFQYRASTQTLRVYSKLKIRIVPEEGVPVINPLLGMSETHKAVSPTMNRIYQSLYGNYNSGQFAEGSLTLGEEGEILVVYTARDREAIIPYVSWKKQRGYQVSTVEVPRGSNVKNVIATAYKKNAKILYVQLVGGWGDLKSDLGPQSAPMDPILGCVRGNDFYPELIVGRFSANSAEQVGVQIAKAINYEKTTGIEGDWYKTGLGIASEEGAGAGDDEEADYQHMDIIRQFKLLKYSYSHVYEAYKNPTKQFVVDIINKGVGIINYIGHGTETNWVTSGYGINEIKKSTNKDRLPVIISVACVNGAFHKTGGSFAEAFLNQQSGGAVATLMSTINQPWAPPMRGQDYMNDIIIQGYDYQKNPGDGQNVDFGRTTFGSITFNGMILMYSEAKGYDDLDTLKTWTLFGDASLEVRTDKAKQIISSSASVDENSPYYAVITFADGETKVKGARVTLSRDNQIYSAVTDENGEVTISHELIRGPAVLAVTGYNLRTIYQTIMVQ